jgi:hypothetical protein
MGEAEERVICHNPDPLLHLVVAIYDQSQNLNRFESFHSLADESQANLLANM